MQGRAMIVQDEEGLAVLATEHIGERRVDSGTQEYPPVIGKKKDVVSVGADADGDPGAIGRWVDMDDLRAGELPV